MKNHINTFLIGATIIISIVILSHTYKNRNATRSNISVTGLGEMDFTSDLIVWKTQYSTKNNTLQGAYSQIKKDQETIKKYLINKKIKPEEIIFSSVNISKTYENYYDINNNRRSRFTGYELNQETEIESKEVDKIEKIAREITELINENINIHSYSPRYYYTKLAELKIKMIAEATQDAHLRAQKIAENANAKVGKLKDAKMGVFQIIAPNSNETYSWGGTFNTSSKRKRATITMKLNFGIEN